jgi:hypothetical protein
MGVAPATKTEILTKNGHYVAHANAALERSIHYKRCRGYAPNLIWYVLQVFWQTLWVSGSMYLNYPFTSAPVFTPCVLRNTK